MVEASKKITEQVSIPEETASSIKKNVKDVFSFKNEIDQALSKDISALLETILGGAVCLGSSDVHLEPQEKEGSKVRIRIDGLLHDITLIAPKAYDKLLSRIKLLSGIKLNVTDRPQDGRFSVLLEYGIEIRVSTLPTEYGESIVIRILNPKSLIKVDGLGLRKDLEALFKKEIKRPNGMVIVTGPTGSGKTTTLYAFLKEVENPEIKIITIEDPIEYHLKGISQTQVNSKKGYTFASGLRSIVRQDPDVVLVGEIRDKETANISIQAALTGHLVFSTLHTNDAAGTVARLMSMGSEPKNIGPATNLVIAQRLIRKICKKCGKKETASPQLLSKIKQGLKGISPKITVPKITSKTEIVVAKGCKDCNNTGYKGRLGIFEALPINDEMEKFILKNPSIAALRGEAIKQGMATIYQDGLIKVLEGITTIEEVERVSEKK